MNSQSIILNLNKGYAKGEAHNYLTPVSQAFDIGQEAEVSLYGANLKRKPIALTKDEDVTTQTCQLDIGGVMFPINSQLLGNTLCDSSNIPRFDENLYTDEQPLFELNIESDDYSRDEFCDRISIEANSYITEVLNNQVVRDDQAQQIHVDGLPMHLEMPYQYLYDKDNFFLGLAGVPRIQGISRERFTTGCVNPCQIFGVDNTETVNTTGAKLVEYVNDDTESRGIMNIRCNAAINVTDYSAFAQICSSPIFPLLKETMDNNYFKGTQSFFEFDVDIIDTVNTYEKDFVVGFTNTYLQSNWAASDTPEVSTLIPTNKQVPNYLFIGARFFEKSQAGTIEESYCELFIPPALTHRFEYLDESEDLTDMFSGVGYMRLAMIGLEDYDSDHQGLGGKYGFRFISKENQSQVYQNIQDQGANFTEKNVFPRVYGFQFYARPSGEDEHILYDSRDHDVYFPSNIIEDGYLFNSATSVRNPVEKTNLGFQPYLFVNELLGNEGISNPNGNFIAYKNFTPNQIMYRAGMESYNYKVVNEVLRDILGVNKEGSKQITILRNETGKSNVITFATEEQYNPNAYPFYRNSGGLTQLFTDNNTYNIEINLPVDCYATTKSSNKVNNIGQKRTIIYKTEPFLEGNISDVNQTFIFKNIVPNNLKFLTLDNTVPLNLNNMNVQIRRSDTNELATELEDASIELLIRSNKK
jgi:hypothetical protein